MTNIEELEQLFFKVIGDLEEFLPYLVIVGGWVPYYLYVKYLWKNFSVYPVTTTDIDFGFSESAKVLSVKESIYSRLSRLQYRERHLKMDRLFPIVPMLEHPKKTSKLMIEFITTPSVENTFIERFIGRQILVNRLDKFDILLSDRIQIELVNRKFSPYHSYIVNVPPPYIFLFHKTLTFIDRENLEKKAKDIYYVYYVLRFHPKKGSLLHDLKTVNLHREKMEVVANLQTFFSRVTSEGCLMVEKENGPDDYIFDVREDAFERFNELIDTLSS